MKSYEKPRLIALPLSGSNALCAGCAIDAMEPNMDLNIKFLISDLVNPFTSDAGSECAADDIVEGYCKYTAGSDGKSVIFDS